MPTQWQISRRLMFPSMERHRYNFSILPEVDFYVDVWKQLLSQRTIMRSSAAPPHAAGRIGRPYTNQSDAAIAPRHRTPYSVLRLYIISNIPPISLNALCKNFGRRLLVNEKSIRVQCQAVVNLVSRYNALPSPFLSLEDLQSRAARSVITPVAELLPFHI